MTELGVNWGRRARGKAHLHSDAESGRKIDQVSVRAGVAFAFKGKVSMPHAAGSVEVLARELMRGSSIRKAVQRATSIWAPIDFRVSPGVDPNKSLEENRLWTPPNSDASKP